MTARAHVNTLKTPGKRTLFHPFTRAESTGVGGVGPMENPSFHRGTLWFENTFPFKGFLSPLSYFIKRYADNYLANQNWKTLIPSQFPSGALFIPESAEPNLKEGGLYLTFKYAGGTIDEAVESVQTHLKSTGAVSYLNLGRINAFQVKGRPWVEDMVSRVPTSRLHVDFEGPPLSVEQLYREFRVFGRIVDISLQPTTAKDPPPRFASVEFLRKRAATSARNCIHGELIETTKVMIGYEKQSSKWSSFWHWITSNLRISVPLLLALATGLSYLIFDPLRVFFITNKATGRYSLEEYTTGVSNWISAILSLFKKTPRIKSKKARQSEGWLEREAEEKRLETYLKQVPETLVLVTGPKGSGKSELVQLAIKPKKFKVVIKCDELVGQLDHDILSGLATQLNFFPSFGFLVQASSFMDAMITATTGAKAGLSTTKDGEMRKMLDSVTIALTDLIEKQKSSREKALFELRQLDSSEENDIQVPEVDYPVVVIEDFLSKENVRGQFVYDVLAEWAASLSEYRIAHFVFVSDNLASARSLGKCTRF